MPQARLIVCNRSGSSLGELSRAQLKSVSWQLNEPGELSFSMHQTDPRVGLPSLAGNEIQLWIDDVLSWWGVPWRCRNTSKMAEFSCEGLLSYFHKRFVTNASIQYTSTEQFAIAQGIVTTMQAGTNQSFNIGNASVPASGVVRSREWKREDHPNALDMLKEFVDLRRADTGVKDGFDISVEIGGGTRAFTPWYPQKGVYRPTAVLEYGRNISDFSVDEDALELANRAYVTGGSNGDIKFENNYTDTTSTAARGEFQAIISDGDQNDVNVLLQKARTYVEQHKDVALNPSLSAAMVPVNLLGVLQTGDTVPVRIQRGRINLAGIYRIGTITWQVRPNVLKLDFVEAA